MSHILLSLAIMAVTAKTLPVSSHILPAVDQRDDVIEFGCGPYHASRIAVHTERMFAEVLLPNALQLATPYALDHWLLCCQPRGHGLRTEG